MADFDKNLQPIIKPTGYKLTDVKLNPAGSPQMNFPSQGGGGVSDLSGESDVFNKLKAASVPTSSKGIFISNAELEANKRYKVFNPVIGDYEDFAAQGQEWYKQAANGILKGANLAATTVAGGFGTLYGVAKAISPGGKFSDIFQNEVMTTLDDWNNYVDNELLPNYYTAAERNSEWYSTDNWFTTNFLFDKLIKNSGFAVGAMVGGNIANAGLVKLGTKLGGLAAKGAVAAEASQGFKLFTPLLRNTSRAFSAGKNAEVADILKSQISSIADLSRTTSKIANIDKQFLQFAKFSDGARRTAVAAYSSAGEASFEALQTSKEYRDNLIAEYVRQTGSEPVGDELSKIDREAAEVGKTSFLGNMALLAITEYAQLPYLIGSNYNASRQAANSLLGQTEEVAKDVAGKYGAVNIPKTKFGKIYQGVKRTGAYVFDPKESAQEILQYGLQTGTQNYFKKGRENGEADLFVDGFLYGLIGKDEYGEGVGALVSKEGIEGGILGGITGGGMQAISTYGNNKALAKNTKSFIDMLDNAPTFKEAFQERLDAGNRGVVLQQQHRDSIINGDKLEERDLFNDQMHNYLAPRIKYGRFDMVTEDLKELKQIGMTESGLAELKEQGMANINDTVTTFQKRITSIENSANNLNDIYQSLNLRYAGESIEVDGKPMRKYPPLIIDQLAYAGTKISNYDVRIPQLNSKLTSAGINTQAILQDIIETGTPNTAATKEALSLINSMDVTSDIKDELKGTLDDVIELSLRRKMFIAEYDGIKNNPLNYQRPEEEIADVDVIQKEGRKKVTKTLEVGKSYSLMEPITFEKGKIVLAPKVSILSSTLGGEFEVQLPDGSVTFFSPEQFDKYKLSEEDNTSQELENILNQSIDDVLNYPAFRDVVEKPEEGINKLEYVNSLGNQKFSKAVINRFNKFSKEFLEKIEKRKQTENDIKNQSSEINKQQDSIADKKGDPKVVEIPFDTRIDTGETGPLKKAADFFNSSSSASDDPNFKNYEKNPAPHIIRSRVFLNKIRNNKKRNKFRAITFTSIQEEALGLSGIAQLSYGANWETQKENVNNLIDGFVAQVYVEVDGKNRYFIDQNGNRIKNAEGKDAEVGQQVDLGKVVFETRPTVKEYNSDNSNRFRTGEKEEFLKNMEIWKSQREMLLGNPDKQISPMTAKDLPTSSFRISKGFAIRTEKKDGKYIKNKVGDTIVTESQINTEPNLLKISTGTPITHSGENMNAKPGMVYLQSNDLLQVLNNNLLGNKKAKTVYEVIKSMITEMESQATNGKKVTLDRQKLLYLRSVLIYARPEKEMSTNQLWIDIDSMSVKLGSNSYKISEFASRESEITKVLSETYHSANKRTLDKNDPYFEFVFDNDKLSYVKWSNYQSYLISGKNRSVEDIPFVTNVSKISESSPYNYAGKYATLINFSVGEKNTNFKAPEVAEQKPPVAPPKGKSEENAPSEVKETLPTMKLGSFTLNDGSINDFEISKQVVKAEASYDGSSFNAVIDFSEDTDVGKINKKSLENLLSTITEETLNKYRVAIPALNENSSKEDTIVEFFKYQILVKLGKALKVQLEEQASAPPSASEALEAKPVEEKKTIPTEEPPLTPPPSRPNFKSGYSDTRVVAKGELTSKRISGRDIEEFKKWHAKKVKNMPFEILDNLVSVTKTKKAWGVYENGVAKFFKSGLRGTEYHEIFEGIWKGFLTQDERTALLDEFKDKPGYFLDRETGKQIAFIDATDRQAKERIADDFADFRLGKLPARSLTERIKKFFKSIIEFFKSFVNKPSLKDGLFESIEAGRFAESVLPDYIKTEQPEYRNVMTLPSGYSLSEDESWNIVQDMVISTSGYLLNRENDDTVSKVFDLKGVTGSEVYNFIRSVYESKDNGNFELLGEANFNELFLRSVDSLKTIGVTIDVNSIVSVNDENGNNKLYSPEAFEVDFKKNMKFAIKYLIATTPAAESNKLGKDGLPILKEGAARLPVLSNFNRTFATLLSNISNTSLKNIPKKLMELYKKDGNYYRMVRSLKGQIGAEESEELFDFKNFEDDDWKLYIQFVQAFNKSKPDSVVESRNVTTDGVNVISKPADRASAINIEKYNWLSNLKTLATEANSMISRKKLQYFINTEHPNYPKKLPNTTEERLAFLKNIGINFPATSITDQNKFIDAVNSIYQYGSKEIASVKNFTKADSSVIKLATMYVNSVNPDHDTTRFNVENKRTGNYSDSNAVSVFEEDFNESNTIDELLEKRPELKDPYSQNSLLIKKGGIFFNEDGDKIKGKILKVGVVDGIIDDDGGTTIGSLTEGARFSLEINQNLKGNYYILIPADSSTERTYNIGNVIKFEDVNTDIGNSEFFEIMNSYLEDEINLALDWKNREKLAAVGDKRATQLRFFKEILSPELVENIEKVISDKRLSEKTAKSRIAEIIKNNKSEIESSILDTVAYLNGQLNQNLISTGEVFVSGEDTVAFTNLDTDFADAKKLNKSAIQNNDYNNLLSFINMNNMIANTELHKFIFGDPYQFKIKNGNLDETKRIKSWLSPRRKTFDYEEFNEHLNKDYNKVTDDIVLSGEDLTRYNFKSFVKTVTLTDPRPKSKYIDELVGYEEPDGFSIIQIGAFREVKLKNAEWSNEAETWYQWQMAYARQKLSKIKSASGEFVYKYGEDNKALEKHDAELIQKKEPYYVLEVLKPIVSGAKPNLDRIEGTIDKFSQMPIFFKAIEETHLQDLYIQMLEDQVGYVVYQSGRKEGARSTHNTYNGNGTFNSSRFGENTIEEIAWSTYGIQVENSYEEGKNQTRGGQLMKNVSMDMFENGKSVMPGAEELYKKITETHNEFHDLQYEEFLNKLGIKDLGDRFEIIDNKKVSETLEYELLRREASQNVIDTIRLDENGQFRMPFEASSAYEEIQSVLYSLINKSLISPPMNGKAHVQTPVTLWENRNEGRRIIRNLGKDANGKNKYAEINRDEYNALSDENKKTVMLSSDTLKFYEDEDGKRHMEIMIPNFWKKYFKGMSDEKILEYLNKKENQKILFGIGFRIPHQSASSTEIFKIKGFLHPSMGATVVVPSEIVSKAGSDFDIDKLNMYLKSVYVDVNGDVKLVEYKGSKQSTIDFYDKVFNDVISKEAEQILNDREFMDQLYEFFDVYEEIENASELEPYDLKLALGEEQFSFYAKFEKTIGRMINRSSEKDMSPLDYITTLMAKSAGRFEKIATKSIYDVMKNDFVNDMYKKSLENRYFELLQDIVTLPENFKRLMTPVGDAGLPAVASELNKARQDEESSIKYKLLSKSYLTSLRHAFLLGKKWVGIAAVNITGHSIAQKINAHLDPTRLNNIDEYDAGFLGDMSLAIPHNTIEVNGQKMISLAGRNLVYDDSLFISDRLSGYATAFVDIAKDPYIMKILRSDLVVGTAMFMERIGTGELTPFFLNQPIIIDYLKYLDKINSRSLFSKSNGKIAYSMYPVEAGTGYDLSQDFPINPETGFVDFEKSKANLLASIDINADRKSPEFNLKQQAVLSEFLRLAKMAQYSFKFSQAYNYDTTRVRSTEGVLRKAMRTKTAETENIISSINDVFEQTFIGKQKELIVREVKSLSSLFKLNETQFYEVIDEVIKPFASDEYMSLDDFDRIIKKIKTSMIDYLLQTQSDKFSKERINELLIGKNNIASQLYKIQKKYPGMELISSLEARFSEYEDGAVTITLKAKPTDAITTNRYIAMMRELKALEPKFYENLILASFLQGTYDTRISINKIVPLEDRADILTPIINSKYSFEKIKDFSRNGIFFRTNFSDSKIVPFYSPKYVDADQGIGYGRTGFAKIKELGATLENGKVLRLSKKYESFNNSDMSFLKVKRYQYIAKRMIDITGQYNPIGLDAFNKGAENGVFLKSEIVGYQKVIDLSGSPLEDDKGNVYFKMVNLYGDGDIAKIYKVDGLPSSIPNNTYTVKQELSDSAIIGAVNNEIVVAPEPFIEQSVMQTPQAIDQPIVPVGFVPVSPDYGVYKSDQQLSKEKTEEYINLISPQAENQTFKENKGKNANMMFHYGLRWGRRGGNPDTGVPRMFSPINNNSADGGTYYGYDRKDQKGNDLPSVNVLRPIMDEIFQRTGIDMNNYDSVIANIYLEGEYIYPHRDTTEDKSAKNYPVVVYTLGNDAALGIWDYNKGGVTFANTYDSRYAPGNLKSLNPTNEVLTKNGSIYTFGLEGKGRFTLVHATPDVTSKPIKYPPIKLPNGKTIENYTITLTFRRAQATDVVSPTNYERLTSTSMSQQPTTPTVVTEQVVPETPIVIDEQSLIKKSKFTYKGKSIDTQFELTEGQRQALEKLVDFATDPSSKFITLQGAAGTGKTSVIGYLQKYLNSSTFNFFAPTHAATAELAFATVKTGNRMMPMTVASALNQAYDPVTNTTSAILTRKITDRLGLRNNVFVVDEVSMLNSKDYDALKSIIDKNKIKVIFMGDIMQIPEVDSQNPKKKLVSKAFTEHDQVLLTEVKRTSSDSILNMLVNVRNNINDKIPLVQPSEELQYLPTSEFNEEVANKFEKDPEETVLINYRNVGVEEYNKKIRSVLGRVGELVPNDVVVGYLGYSSKQVDKANIANSIRYTIQSVVKSGPIYKITASSKKLQALEDLGVRGVSGMASTDYIQLSRSDSFDFPNLTEEDFDKNNKTISNLMQQLKDAKDYALANKSKGLAWVRYYEAKDKVSVFFSSHDLGGDYIYNPSSEKMEKYSNEIHKNIDKDMRVEKGIDFGHAITIHKSQGTTVKNVFFDANSLPSWSTSKLMQSGKQIGTEKHSLLYVGISRASEYLGIHYANMANFYIPESEQPQGVQKNIVPSEGEMTLKNGKIYPFSKINSKMLEVIGYSPEEIGNILKSIC
jgi:hypothetical protein